MENTMTRHAPPLLRQRSAIGIGAGAALAVALIAPMARADEAQARALLKGMTDYLAAQPSLSFDVDSSLEVVTDDDQKLTIASSGSIAMERPGRLHLLRQGGFATIELVFDGTTLSVLNREANTYAQSEVPGTVDDLIDALRETYHLPLPAADLLGVDAGATLLADVTAVKDLGSGFIRGEECDHLAFRSGEVDWQIWIAQGDVPHPCRFVVTTKDIAGWPEYTLEFSAWGAGAIQAVAAFEPPADATKVEVQALPDLDEVGGIFSVKKDG
jgi:hypothetical protein